MWKVNDNSFLCRFVFLIIFFQEMFRSKLFTLDDKTSQGKRHKQNNTEPAKKIG